MSMYRQAAEVDSFPEGPSFDRAGNLYFVDIPFGRMFRITPRGRWELVVEYDGWPNGLKLHRDGRFFVAGFPRMHNRDGSFGFSGAERHHRKQRDHAQGPRALPPDEHCFVG